MTAMTTASRRNQVMAATTNRIRLQVHLSLALIAVVAWGAAFLAPESLYWDDWVVVNSDTLRMTKELGLPWIGYVYVVLFALGPWTFKVIAVLATIVVGWTCFAISGRGLGLNFRERWLLAALVIALPLFSARAIAVLSTYSWSLALFFCAWYLLVRKHPDSPGRTRYVAAAVFFFVSYTTGSLLLFTAIPVAHLAYLTIPSSALKGKGTLRFIARFWYVLAAPVFFWTMRTLFFQPYGLYKDYNKFLFLENPSSVTIAAAVCLLFILVLVILVLLYWLRADYPKPARLRRELSLGTLAVTTGAMGLFLLATRVSVASTALAIPATIVMCSIILCAMIVHRAIRGSKTKDQTEIESRKSEVMPILAGGLIVLVLGELPYLLVGKLPSSSGWETRHQLLIPFGVAVIIVATVRALAAILPLSVIRVVSIGLVALFVFVSLNISLSLVADWRKQMQVTEALAQEPLVKEASTIVFSDHARELNFDSRKFEFYEYNGWLWTAFGEQSRLGIDRMALHGFLTGQIPGRDYPASRYGFGDHTPSTAGVLVEIVPVQNASRWTLLMGQTSISLRVTPIEDLASLR